MTMTTTNQASDTLGRIAAYVGYLFEDVSENQTIELHHFDCEQRTAKQATRGLNRPYELGELMSLTYPH
jgi:hypothetical protein